MSDPESEATGPIKLRKKGGSLFPRHDLETTVEFAKKLVSKTHTGAQPKEIILSGVLGATSWRGGMKLAAMKQFGFIENAGDNYSASKLAKNIAHAPPDELPPLYRQAALHPRVFKQVFDTFHGDTVSKAKIKQRAALVGVHPDLVDECVNVYVTTLEFAKLVSVDGDQVAHVHAQDAANKPVQESGASEEDAESDQESGSAEAAGAGDADGLGDDTEPGTPVKPAGGRAIIHVNVTLDSSLDTDKLERQLKLLRRYGAL